MREMNYVPIGTIKPFENNPRKNDGAVNAVAESIKQFGFNQPIAVDKKNVIVVGHTRYKAALKLGLKEVPVVVLSGLTDKQCKAYRLADNKTNELAEWLPDLENMELDEIGNDIDMSLFGFDKLKADMPIIEDTVNIDEVEPVSKLGDIYQLGRHIVMCGDSTNPDDIRKLMGGVQADLVFTDPPYGIAIQSKDGTIGGDSKRAPTTKFHKFKNDDSTATAEASYKVLVNLGYEKFILFGGNYFVPFLPYSDGWLIWDKRGGDWNNNFADGEMAWCSFHTPLRIYRQLWSGYVREGESGDRLHPTQKPVRMIADIMKDFSNDADVILDPFGGSGTMLIAAEQTGRTCYTMEFEPFYADVIVKRYEDLTGNKAVKIRR